MRKPYPGDHFSTGPGYTRKIMINPTKRMVQEVPFVSLLEVSVEAGDLGPVIVLAGDADGSPTMQLDEALTAQVSTRTSHLTIDVTNLRSIDPATAQTLMLAALIVMVQGGSTVLVNPQEPVLQDAEPHTHNRDVHDPSPDTGRDRTGHQRRPSNERRPVPMTDHEHKLDGSITLRRQPASLSTGHQEATPARSRSSAASAVTIPAWSTGRSHPSCARSADPTCLGPVSQRS